MIASRSDCTAILILSNNIRTQGRELCFGREILEFWCEGIRREGKILVDSDFNSAAITDVVLVADTDVADFALAAGGEKGVICAQCGAGPSTYPPSDAPTIRVINGNAEVWLFRGARSAHNCLVGGSSPPRGVRIKLIKK